MSEEKQEGEGFLAGFILGGLIGAGLALLLGGEDSAELREKLKKKGKVALKNLQELAEEGKEKIEDRVEEVKEELPEKVMDQVGEAKENLQETAEDLQKTGRSTLRRFFLKAGKKLAK